MLCAEEELVLRLCCWHCFCQESVPVDGPAEKAPGSGGDFRFGERKVPLSHFTVVWWPALFHSCCPHCFSLCSSWLKSFPEIFLPCLEIFQLNLQWEPYLHLHWRKNYTHFNALLLWPNSRVSLESFLVYTVSWSGKDLVWGDKTWSSNIAFS